MGLFGFVLAIGARPILSALTDEQRVVGLAVLPLQIVAFILPFEATNQVLSGAFRGAGDTRWPFLVTTAGNWLLRLPITLLVIGRFGLLGAWAAVMIEITIRAVINAWRFFRMDWVGGVQPVMIGVEK
jgi:Na+-driven multidrug efflux pump